MLPMNTGNLPGFTAEVSLRKAHREFRLVVNEANHTRKGAITPQYCQCYASPTLYAGPNGPQWGPPYHYHCYGSDCFRISRSVFGH